MAFARRGFVFIDLRQRDFRYVVDSGKYGEQNGEADAGFNRNAGTGRRNDSRTPDLDIRQLGRRPDAVAQIRADFADAELDFNAQTADGFDAGSGSFNTDAGSFHSDAKTVNSETAADANAARHSSPAIGLQPSAAARLPSIAQLRYRVLTRNG